MRLFEFFFNSLQPGRGFMQKIANTSVVSTMKASILLHTLDQNADKVWEGGNIIFFFNDIWPNTWRRSSGGGILLA